MKDREKPLTPVNREDFSTDFGGNRSVEHIEPLSYFGPIINQYYKLSAGPGFWFIADTAKGITLAAGGTPEKVCGISISDLVNHTPDILFAQCHPEDITHLFSFTQYWIKFFLALPPERKCQMHPTIYIRMRNPSQQFAWIMIQYADHIFDADGNIAYGLTLVTDLSPIKKDGKPLMSILDQKDNCCQYFICSNGRTFPDPSGSSPTISPREIDVLRLLATGKSSKQMATELNIALKTIDNHRQSMLRKTNTKSTGELVAWGINHGYL